MYKKTTYLCNGAICSHHSYFLISYHLIFSTTKRTSHFVCHITRVLTWQELGWELLAGWWWVYHYWSGLLCTGQVYFWIGRVQSELKPVAADHQHCSLCSSAQRSNQCLAAVAWSASSWGCLGLPHSAGYKGSTGGRGSISLSCTAH